MYRGVEKTAFNAKASSKQGELPGGGGGGSSVEHLSRAGLGTVST